MKTRMICGFFALGSALLGSLSACGDDSFIATNEIIDEDAGATGGNGGDGSGGSSGSAGNAGAAGTAGTGSCTPGETIDLGSCEKCGVSRRVCDETGSFGAPVCEEQGECEVGAEETQACGSCGSQKRTCSATCSWEPFGACGGEGVCAPGAVGSCAEGCEEKHCGNDCQWGACQLKAGAACAWEQGTNFKCCGTDSWQYCSQSCQWYPCASCNGCSAC